MSVRTIVLFGALAWVSGSLLVVMNRGALATGRVAGVSVSAKVEQPTGSAVVSLPNEKTLYLRSGVKVWRIADTKTLQQVAQRVSAREGRSNLDGLEPSGTVNAANWSNVLGPALPREPVDDGEENPVPTAGPIRLSVATSTPPAATLPDGTQLNPVLAIRIQSLSGLPVQVTSITLTQQLASFASNSTSTLPTSTVFDGVTAWDGAVRHGTRGTFSLDQRATVDLSANPIVVAPLTTKVVTFKADLPANAPAQLGDYGVRLAVAAAADVAQTGGSTIGARFPLRGNLFSWVDGAEAVGALSVEGLDGRGYSEQPNVGTPTNAFIGQENLNLGTFYLQTAASGQEPFILERITFNVEGTRGIGGGLGVFKLLEDNGMPFEAHRLVATATADDNGAVTFHLVDSQPSIHRRFSVTSDVTFFGGSGWVRLSIQSPFDVLARGENSGSYLRINDDAEWSEPIAAPYGYWKMGSITEATRVRIERDSSFPAYVQVHPGVNWQPIAQYRIWNQSATTTVDTLQFHLGFPNAEENGELGYVINLNAYEVVGSSTVMLGQVNYPYTEASIPLSLPLASGQARTIQVRASISSLAPNGYAFYPWVPALGVQGGAPSNGPRRAGDYVPIHGQTVSVTPSSSAP